MEAEAEAGAEAGGDDGDDGDGDDGDGDDGDGEEKTLPSSLTLRECGNGQREEERSQSFRSPFLLSLDSPSPVKLCLAQL